VSLCADASCFACRYAGSDAARGSVCRYGFDRDLVMRWRLFGPSCLCRKLHGGWYVSFMGQGFPSPFKTKKGAINAANDWALARAAVLKAEERSPKA
jgi:hypothetical protein